LPRGQLGGYHGAMPALPDFVPPSIPTLAAKPPAGADWIHEIKHDGYRLQVRRDGDDVRLFTRRGFGWTERYPAIAAASPELDRRLRPYVRNLSGGYVVRDGNGQALA
jgi:ATP-dependent DNA ligase